VLTLTPPGEDALTVGSGEGTAIEIGRNEVCETVFVGDETMKYVVSSFFRKHCGDIIMCSFERAGVRDIEGRVNDIVSGHGIGRSWWWYTEE